MLSFHFHHRSAILFLNPTAFPPPTFKPFLSPSSLPFCTNTSHSPSFAESYLIENLGFSPQSASKLCSTHTFRFKTPQKPDSVLTFFRTYGFSDTQLHNIITKEPSLLSCNPSIRVLPKFQFFHSKGASTSDIVNLVTKNPFILTPSLNNQIVPTYELCYRLLKSDKEIIVLLNYHSTIFSDGRVARKVRMLIEKGVTESNVARLLRKWHMVFITRDNDMLKIVGELKDMGFDPSKPKFAIAFVAKAILYKTRWNERVDDFKKWGWSDEDVLQAFKRQPYCMVTSADKINLVMSFWVNHLGWDALTLVKAPTVITYSLERRIIPRAAVLQFLLQNDLRKKNASLTTPFIISEKLFRVNYIKRFKEESSYLLNLYEEKLNLAYTMDNTTGMS